MTAGQRSDITLELIHAVAWRGASLEIGLDALAVTDRCQEAFEGFVSERVKDDPHALVFGVTSAPGCRRDAGRACIAGRARSVKRRLGQDSGLGQSVLREARAIASPTLLSLGGFGQNDVPALGFLAWRKAAATANCLDGSLAVLAALASQALYVAEREAPPNVGPLVDRVSATLRP